MARSWPASGAAQTASRWSSTPRRPSIAAGYKVRKTWDELMALTEQIAEDGDTPWCIGIESGAATVGDDRLDRRRHAAHDFPREL